MTTLYKLTDQDGYTRRGETGETLWRIGVPVSASGEGIGLCTNGVIHAYADPLVAIYMNPVHAGFKTPRLFRAEGEIVADDRGLKCGVRTLTLMEEMPVPAISLAAQAHAAIRCAMLVCDDADWLMWAEGWLSGRDRSRAAAEAWAAREAAAAAAARVAAAVAREATTWAAAVAAALAVAAKPLDLPRIISDAIAAEAEG